MDFKVDNGPWQTIFEGKLYGHNVEIVVNPENYYLTIIYDEKDNEKVGALVEGNKALVAKGALDSFIQSISKPCIGVTKNTGDRTYKMIFVSFPPVYLDFKQEDYIRKVDNAIKKSYNSISTITELARSSALSLREVSTAPEYESSSILGDPFTARALLSGLKKSALELIDLKGISKYERESNSIQLGLGKTREIIKEPTSDLERSIVIGKEKESVLYTIYVLTENFLLDNKTTIIFDSNDYFSELSFASKNDKVLKDALVDYEPAGFPLKKFIAKKDIRLSVADADMEIILRAIGANDSKIISAIAKSAASAKVKTPLELAGHAGEMSELNDFEKLKAERLLNIVANDYNELFGESIDIKELIKKWPGNLGRATIIDTKEMSEQERIVFNQATLKMISKKLENNVDGLVFVMPDIEEVLSFEKEKVIDNILQLENHGIGFIFGSGKSINELTENVTATLTIVSGKDTAVAIKNKRNYRVHLRPTLSGNKAYS